MFKKINGLQFLRYSITWTENDKLPIFYMFRPASVVFKATMSTTYANLIEKHISHLNQTVSPSSLEQVRRNHMTALRKFMQQRQLHETSPVGDELREGFDAAVRGHVECLDLADRSKRDRKTLLNAWRETFNSFPVSSRYSSRERQRASDFSVNQTPFERVLRDSLKKAGLTPKGAARLGGLSTSALGRWSRGAVPNSRSKNTILQLERVLNVEPGILYAAFEETIGASEDAQNKDAFRARLKKNIGDVYRLKPDEVGAEFSAEWHALLRFKTAPVSKLKRSSAGKWTTQLAVHSLTLPSQFVSVGQAVCPSAEIAFSRVASFVGYLRLPKEDGGFGLDFRDSQSLAWLAVPDAIEGYFEFMVERADGLKHGGLYGFCTFASSMLHPVHGFLTQQPEYMEKIIQKYRMGTWIEMCADAREVATALKNDCHDKSRDPSTPIEPLLALDEPLKPIFEAMAKLRKIGDGALAGTLDEARARRDELLLGLLVFNPLRAGNIVTLSYKRDGSGDVSRDMQGNWSIKLNAGRMKNRKRVTGQVYVVTLPKWLSQLFEAYVASHRLVLLGGKSSDYFFVSGFGKKFNTMSRRLQRLTRWLIPGCSGFGMHAMRHLVATNWLMKNPNDFLTVAELLNDKLETVMANYAHLKKDTAFGRYNEQLESLLGSIQGFSR